MSLPLQNGGWWALAACIVSAVFEGIMSGTGVKSRFAELRLPTHSPGVWAWSIVGGTYYVLFFFLLRSLLDRPPTRYWTSVALSLAAVLLAANASWNWIFFRRKDLWLSFVFFLPYLLLALNLGAVLHHLRNPLARWYALYLAYLVYAAWWGFRIWRLNRHITSEPGAG